MIIVDTFATGAVSAENYGRHRRLVFYSERPIEGGGAERIVVARIVCTDEGFGSIKRALCDRSGDGQDNGSEH